MPRGKPAPGSRYYKKKKKPAPLSDIRSSAARKTKKSEFKTAYKGKPPKRGAPVKRPNKPLSKTQREAIKRLRTPGTGFGIGKSPEDRQKQFARSARREQKNLSHRLKQDYGKDDPGLVEVLLSTPTPATGAAGVLGIGGRLLGKKVLGSLAKKGAEEVGQQVGKSTTKKLGQRIVARSKRKRVAQAAKERKIASKARPGSRQPAKAAKTRAERKASRAAEKRATKRLKPKGKGTLKSKAKVKGKRTLKRHAPSKAGVKNKPYELARLANNPAVQTTLGASGVGTALGVPALAGHLKAVKEDPATTGKRTAQGAAGMVAGVASLVGDTAATAGRGASAGLHEAGVPGFKAYSGKEILAPAKGQAKMQASYVKDLAELAAKGDVDAWAKAVKDKYGLTLAATSPLFVRGGVKFAERVGGKTPHGQRVGKRRSRAQKARDADPRLDVLPSGARREAAERVGRGRSAAEHEIRPRVEKVRRKALQGKVRGREHLVPFLAEGRFSTNPVKAVTQLENRKKALEAEGRKLGEFSKTRTRRVRKDKTEKVNADLDAIQELLDNPSLLTDKDMEAAVRAYKDAQPRDTRFHVEARASYPQAVEYGTLLPEERLPQSVRDVTSARTRKELEKELDADRVALKAMHRKVVKLRGRLQEAREAGNDARAADMEQQLKTAMAERARHEEVTKKKLIALRNKLTPEEHKAALEIAARELGLENLDDIYEAQYAGSRRRVIAEARKHKATNIKAKELMPEFMRDIRQLRKREELPDDPAYVRHHPVERNAGIKSLHQEFARLPGDLRKPFEGKLQRQGKVTREFGVNLAQSIASPIASETLYKITESFLRDEHIRIPGVKSTHKDDVALYTGKQIDEAARAGLIDDRGLVQVPWHEFKRAVTNTEGEGTPVSPEKFMDDIAKAVVNGEHEALAGKRYALVPRQKGTEFFDQLSRSMNKSDLLKGMQKLNRFQGRATLGFSPSWLAWQIPAEGFQAVTAGGYRMLKRLDDEFKKLPEQDRHYFEAVMGTTRGSAALPERFGFNMNMFDRTFRVVEKTWAGRQLKDFATGELLGKADRAKSRGYRTKLARAHMDRELNGILHRAPQVFGMTRDLTAKVRGMSRAEQMRFFTQTKEGRRALDEVANYVDEMMGNWVAYTKRERIPAAMAFFYPFMRMSLRWTFHTLPKNHPTRAALLYNLGTLNSGEVRRLLGGDPPFLSALIAAPLHTGPKGKVRLQNVSRMAPSGSAALEAGVVGVGPQDLRALQPALANTLGAITGVDILRGRMVVPEGAEVTPSGEVLQTVSGGNLMSGLTQGQRGRTVMAALMGLWFPSRVITAGKRDVPGELPPGLGGPAGENSGLMKKLLPGRKQAMLNTLTPTPQPPGRARDLGILIEQFQIQQYYRPRTFDTYNYNERERLHAEKQVQKAQRVIDRLYRKYGLKVPKRDPDQSGKSRGQYKFQSKTPPGKSPYRFQHTRVQKYGD